MFPQRKFYENETTIIFKGNSQRNKMKCLWYIVGSGFKHAPTIIYPTNNFPILQKITMFATPKNNFQ